ncbi:MAG: gamma-butyrobetaine dioxygenase, partial [Candidatus Azotimanducaceae bacterium]
MQNNITADKLIVPDFDFYHCDESLIAVDPLDDVLHLTWQDGVEVDVLLMWLREHSPDTETFHVHTREQILKLTDISEDLSIASASIRADGFLIIEWLPEALTSCYHPGWLRNWCTSTSESLLDLPDRQLLNLPTNNQETWLDGNEVLKGEDQAFEHWVEKIYIEGYALLKDLPLEDTVIRLLPEMIGEIKSSNFGDIFEVINLKESNTNANTALALAPHTDLSTREYVPGLQFLFCMENSANGGDSILTDGFSIAEQLKAESNEYYDVLSKTTIPFGTKDKNTDHRFMAPVLEHDYKGQLSTIRYTYWLRLPMNEGLETSRLFYQALKRFQEIANDPANQLKFRLDPGQMMCFDNRRMLHGRTAFDPASGSRR